MSPQHISPEEAVKAFLELGADHFIPMHYGAFRLADDTPQEALERLMQAWKNEKLPESRLQVLALGEILKSTIIGGNT
jgi:L-ascorbate metabolism protein UlaG (beta-lactamase superfamily)